MILLEEKHHKVSVLSASQRGFGSFFHWRTEKNPQQKLLKMVNLMAKSSITSSVFHVAGSGAIMNRFQTLGVTFTPRFLSSCELGGVQEPPEWSCAVRGILIGDEKASRGRTPPPRRPPRWSPGGRASHLDQQKRNGEEVSEGITI